MHNYSFVSIRTSSEIDASKNIYIHFNAIHNMKKKSARKLLIKFYLNQHVVCIPSKNDRKMLKEKLENSSYPTTPIS